MVSKRDTRQPDEVEGVTRLQGGSDRETYHKAMELRKSCLRSEAVAGRGDNLVTRC